MTRFAGLAGLVALLLLLAAPNPALAQDAPCFTGPDRGFGGTGLGEEPHAADSTDRGFGGTGRGDDRGFGGTGQTAGVFGTLTGFGSVCVNGLRIGYDAATPVDRDGVPSEAGSLRRGETLLVDAVWKDGRLEASRISVQPALTGPVTAVDAARGRLEVMGEPVELPPALPDDAGLRLDALALGDRVSIHGLAGTGGTVVATRIERAAPGASAVAVGRVRATAGGGLAVGGVALAGTEAQPGSAVRIAGRWDATSGRLVGERVERALGFATGTRHVSVEARVVGRETTRLETALVRIDASRIARDLGSLPRGARVWADGWLDPSGVLDAERLAIEPSGGGLPEPDPGHGAMLELPRIEHAPAPPARATRATGGSPEGAPARENEDARHETDHARENEDARHETDHARQNEDARHETDHARENEDARHETDQVRQGEDDWRFDPRDFLEPPERIVGTEHDGQESDDRRREDIGNVAEGDGNQGHGGGGYEAPEYEDPEYEAPEYEAPEYEAPEYEAPEYEAPEYEAPEFEAPEFEAPEYEAPEIEH